MPCKNCSCARCVKYYAAKAAKREGLIVPNEVNVVLDIFYNSVNPFVSYAHAGNRKAVLDLVARLGLEKTVKVAEYAVAVQGKQFAPVITTPMQLREKFAALMKFYKDNEKQTPKMVKL
jgi:hypothetical protein